MMEHSRFIRWCLTTTACVMAAVAAFNAVVDPSSLYLKRYSYEKSLDAYVTDLRKARFGVTFRYDERRIKMRLAQTADAASWVLGSSRAMQLGTRLPPTTLIGLPQPLMNLGVSGAGIEDLAMFAAMVADRPGTRAVILSVDPWMLHFAPDTRYTDIIETHARAVALFGLPSSDVWLRRLTDRTRNIVSGDYLMASLKAARQSGFQAQGTDRLVAYEVMESDVGEHQRQTATLCDGTILYSVDYIETAKSMPKRNWRYQWNDAEDKDAGRVLERIMSGLKGRSIAVHVFLAPYNPRLFDGSEADFVAKLMQFETSIRAHAAAAGVPCHGSYDPRAFGLAEADFLDDIHATREALARVPIPVDP